MVNYICLRDENERRSLEIWWRSLNEKRGDRARLRRAETPDDVLLSEPFFNFLQRMPDKWVTSYGLQSSALVAATLAHVKNDRNKESFAAQLGTRKEGTDKPKMSALRFEQLRKSRDPEEFFRRLRRAVHLLGGTVNLLSLSDSILLWMKEYRYGVDRTPAQRLAISWAVDYYKNLPKS